MTQQEKTLIEKVTEWVNSQGYPLEMKVSSRLQDTNFLVQQSVHYIDSQTSKSREIDVICTHDEPIGMARIHYVIECKSAKKPWILFTSKHAVHNRLSALAITSEKARIVLSEHILELKTSLPWFSKDGRNGYSLAQAFTDGIDTPYEAIVSALKASLFLRHDNENRRSFKPPFFFAFPAVITSAPLFECYLDEDGTMKVQEIQEGFLFFDGEFEDYSGTCLRIVNENAIENFKGDIRDMTEGLMKLFQSDIEKELNLLKKQGHS